MDRLIYTGMLALCLPTACIIIGITVVTVGSWHEATDAVSIGFSLAEVGAAATGWLAWLAMLVMSAR